MTLCREAAAKIIHLHQPLFANTPQLRAIAVKGTDTRYLVLSAKLMLGYNVEVIKKCINVNHKDFQELNHIPPMGEKGPWKSLQPEVMNMDNIKIDNVLIRK